MLEVKNMLVYKLLMIFPSSIYTGGVCLIKLRNTVRVYGGLNQTKETYLNLFWYIFIGFLRDNSQSCNFGRQERLFPVINRVYCVTWFNY